MCTGLKRISTFPFRILLSLCSSSLIISRIFKASTRKETTSTFSLANHLLLSQFSEIVCNILSKKFYHQQLGLNNKTEDASQGERQFNITSWSHSLDIASFNWNIIFYLRSVFLFYFKYFGLLLHICISL